MRLRLSQIAKNILSHPREVLSRAHPQEILGKIWENVQEARKRLSRLDLKHRAFEMMGLHEKMMELDDLVLRANVQIEEKYKLVSHQLEKNHSILLALGPSQVLKRGYTYTTLKTGVVIDSKESFNKIKANEKLTLHWADGVGEVVKESL
jgi:exonuclease VII large subunit